MLVVVFFALVIVWVYALVTSKGPLATAAGIGAGVCFALLVVLGIAVGFARAADNRRVRRGLPAALAVWNEAYYCAHCDGVFFPPTAAALGAPVGELLSLYQFRRVVWDAGGYADLV